MSYTYEFERPSVTADIIVMNKHEQILLIERKFEPGKGLWALPGGHINRGEHPIDGARRELKEETNLIVDNLKLFDVRNGKDPRGWYIKTIYSCFTINPDIVTVGDDASHFKWEYISNCIKLEYKNLLFTDHQQIINDYYHTLG